MKCFAAIVGEVISAATGAGSRAGRGTLMAAAVGAVWLGMAPGILAQQAVLKLAEPTEEERAAAQESANQVDMDSLVTWYHEEYPFISMTDSIYTLESEFPFPAGYARPDESALTPFQNWVSRLPLWHRWKPVGIWSGGKAFERDEVSRVVHIPWRGPAYTDLGFPLRIVAEYCRKVRRDYELAIVTKDNGDTLNYGLWLRSKVVLGPLGGAKCVPAVERDSSALEFYRFLSEGMRLQTYKSLAANCDSLADEDVRPGDLLIGHDERGRQGKVYLVLGMLVSEAGEPLYTVATGCPEPQACDYHVPLVTLDRNNPWINRAQVQALVDDLPQWGYFRFRSGN